MSASLVGSEMCIRDRFGNWRVLDHKRGSRDEMLGFERVETKKGAKQAICLLYTSDAADDM
eukprot:12846349-Alexandrium_andersonii.AAC.1